MTPSLDGARIGVLGDRMAKLPQSLTFGGRIVAALALIGAGCIFALLAIFHPDLPSDAGPAGVIITVIAIVLIVVMYFFDIRLRDPDILGADQLSLPDSSGSGGLWGVDVAGSMLVAQRPTKVSVDLVPLSNHEAGHAVGTLVGAETVWERQSRFGRTTIVPHETRFTELPFSLDGPASLRLGVRAHWEGMLTLPDGAPPSVDIPGQVACSWWVEIAVGGTDAFVVQPIYVSGGAPVTDSTEAAERIDTEANAMHIVGVVTPAPLDLARWGSAAFLVGCENSIWARGVVAEIETRFEPTVRHDESIQCLASEGVIAWREARRIQKLPAGRTKFQFEIPALNKLFADATLPHGRVHSVLRFIVKLADGKRAVVEHDLPLRLSGPSIEPIKLQETPPTVVKPARARPPKKEPIVATPPLIVLPDATRTKRGKSKVEALSAVTKEKPIVATPPPAVLPDATRTKRGKSKVEAPPVITKKEPLITTPVAIPVRVRRTKKSKTEDEMPAAIVAPIRSRLVKKDASPVVIKPIRADSVNDAASKDSGRPTRRSNTHI